MNDSNYSRKIEEWTRESRESVKRSGGTELWSARKVRKVRFFVFFIHEIQTTINSAFPLFPLPPPQLYTHNP
jgi:hypothetical protein